MEGIPKSSEERILAEFALHKDEIHKLDAARRGVARSLRTDLMPTSDRVKKLYPNGSDLVATFVGSNTGIPVKKVGTSTIEAITRDLGTNLLTHLSNTGGITFTFTPSSRENTDDGFVREVSLSTVSVGVLPTSGLSGNEFRLDQKLAGITLSSLTEAEQYAARLAAVRETARRMIIQEDSGDEIRSLTESRQSLDVMRERMFANLKRIMDEIRAGK